MLCAPLGGPLSAPVMDRDSTMTARGRKMSARRSGTWLSYHVSRLVKYYVENCERGILTINTVQRINITTCYICPVHFIVKYVAPFWINLNTLVVIGKGCSVTLNQISWFKVKSIFVIILVQTLFSLSLGQFCSEFTTRFPVDRICAVTLNQVSRSGS